MTEIGARVGAIEKSDKETVWLFGYGVYDGRIEHPELGFPNSRITLDDGRKVWGCECWWAVEDVIKSKIGDREVVYV
ncbi:MAG: hypothetical protein WAW36_18900 [Methylovulum miyakonense]|uniref:hypothetical protein n=1 Tax=Methylovulum miyakonense TaxID=645578 RepID=UPI003BB6840F